MMDRRVCEQLEAHGDNLSLEREIDHRVYFSDKSKLKIFEDYLRTRSFFDLTTGKTKLVFGQHFIDFKHIGAPATINHVVYGLFHKAQELDGDYDGWGCSVATSSAA